MDKKSIESFVSKNTMSKNDIEDFLFANNTNINQLLKESFKLLNTYTYIENTNNSIENETLIKNIIYAIDLMCLMTDFNKEEIEINKKRVKKARESLLALSNKYNSIILLDAANKLDELIIDKNINVKDVIKLVKELIDRKEDINIIKKLIMINKNSILSDNNSLFGYVFNKAIDSILNNTQDKYYYITLLKIVYSSKINKLEYITRLNSNIPLDNPFATEIYMIIHGVKRGLDQNEIIDKYRIIEELPDKKIYIPNNKIYETNSITIDNTNTFLRDDALSIKKDGNNYIVGIHITDVGNTITLGDSLDKCALNNYKCLYLAGGKVTRLFNRNIENLLSLNENETKKVISLYVILNDSGHIIDYDLKEDYIHIKDNLTYEESENILSSQKIYELRDELRTLLYLANALESKNQNRLNYWKLKDGENISLKSDIIIREFIVLYGNMLAKITKENNIPYIYRIQDQEYITDLVKELGIKINDYTSNIIKNIYLQSKYSSTPKKHNGLNLDEYTQSSSPSRRYPDLYNQYLLHSFYFKDKPFDFDSQEFEELIQYFNQRSEELSLMKAEYNREIKLQRKK